MVVEGQHQGGFAQGLGAVLLEEIPYDDAGQPLASTLLDYTIPEAPDVPVLRVVHHDKLEVPHRGIVARSRARYIGSAPVSARGIQSAAIGISIAERSSRATSCAFAATPGSTFAAKYCAANRLPR